MRSAHEEARQTAALLLALGRAGSCRRQRRAGPVPLAVQQLGAGRAHDLHPRRRSARSSSYDAERQRDLAATLETYLEQARHHARTCEALHIHPNTLYQRLDRVTEVLGPRWKEPDRALELQVALRLHRLLADHPR